MITYHASTTTDIPQLRLLWHACFNDTVAYVDFFFSVRYRQANALLARDGERVVAAIYLFPRKLKLRGVVLDCYFLVGAATHPEYRKQGIMRELLRRASSVGRSIALYPVSHAIYRPLGWETFVRDTTITLPAQAGVTSFTPCDVSALCKLSAHLDKLFAGVETALLRDETDWQSIYQGEAVDGMQAVLSSDGYGLYALDGERAVFLEAVLSSQRALRELSAYIAQHTPARKLDIQMAPPFFAKKVEPQYKVAAVSVDRVSIQDIEGAMLRITPMSLEGLPVKVQGSIGIAVDDPLEVVSSVRLTASEGVLHISETTRTEARMDIGALSALVAGYYGVDELKAQERITCSTQAFTLLENIFPKVYTLCYDKY